MILWLSPQEESQSCDNLSENDKCDWEFYKFIGCPIRSLLQNVKYIFSSYDYTFFYMYKNYRTSIEWTVLKNLKWISVSLTQ
jgi:hypothetical protein